MSSNELNSYKILDGLTIDFVFSQSDDFIKLFINSFIEDTIHAYPPMPGEVNRSFDDANYIPNPERISCVKGVYERPLLILDRLLTVTYQSDKSKCSSDCLNLIYDGFGLIDMATFRTMTNEIFNEWSQINIEDENKRDELLKTKTPDEIKQNLTDYALEQCIRRINSTKNTHITELPEHLLAEINKRINELEEMGVFSELRFGGRKKYKKYTKKRRYKRKNRKNTMRKYKRRKNVIKK